jgi:hypothetical protein
MTNEEKQAEKIVNQTMIEAMSLNVQYLHASIWLRTMPDDGGN